MRKLYNLSQLVLLSYNTSMTPTPTPSTNGTTAGIDDVMSGINNLQMLFFAIIGVIGSIILGVGCIGAWKSYSEHEGGGDFSKKVAMAVLGFLMMSIGTVIAFLTA